MNHLSHPKLRVNFALSVVCPESESVVRQGVRKGFASVMSLSKVSDGDLLFPNLDYDYLCDRY